MPSDASPRTWGARRCILHSRAWKNPGAAPTVGASSNGEVFPVGALVISSPRPNFAAAAALENMAEEILARVPVLVLVARRLGFDATIGVAISIGSSHGTGAITACRIAS
jgi:hypothetical protein